MRIQKTERMRLTGSLVFSFFIAKHINDWFSIYKNKMHAYSMKNVEII